ncbi:MAG: tRNA pseudouridine(55) synthase TruB [Planctomycetales bacterium]
MFGLINVNKPAGITSRRVVDQIQRLVRPAKAGHAGTLDPLATGVLVVCVGQATRLIEYVQQMKKEYRGTFLLGCSSPSEDTESEVTHLDDPLIPTLQQIQQAIGQWTGLILQRPPAFSALKVGGRRAYQLARQGQLDPLPPRELTIYQLRVVDYQYPKLVLDITCSSGTYIRSLGRDLAETLGTQAVMSALARTAIGGFRLEDACQTELLDQQSLRQNILPSARAIEGLPVFDLTPVDTEELRYGRPIIRAGIESPGRKYAGIYQGQLLAILERYDQETLKPTKVFSDNFDQG